MSQSALADDHYGCRGGANHRSTRVGTHDQEVGNEVTVLWSSLLLTILVAYQVLMGFSSAQASSNCEGRSDRPMGQKQWHREQIVHGLHFEFHLSPSALAIDNQPALSSIIQEQPIKLMYLLIVLIVFQRPRSLIVQPPVKHVLPIHMTGTSCLINHCRSRGTSSSFLACLLFSELPHDLKMKVFIMLELLPHSFSLTLQFLSCKWGMI